MPVSSVVSDMRHRHCVASDIHYCIPALATELLAADGFSTRLRAPTWDCRLGFIGIQSATGAASTTPSADQEATVTGRLVGQSHPLMPPGLLHELPILLIPIRLSCRQPAGNNCWATESSPAESHGGGARLSGRLVSHPGRPLRHHAQCMLRRQTGWSVSVAQTGEEDG